MQEHGEEVLSFLFCFVSFSLLSCPCPALALPPVFLIRLHGDTQKKASRHAKDGTSSGLRYLPRYQGTGKMMSKGPTLESSASARISAEGVGRPLT